MLKISHHQTINVGSILLLALLASSCQNSASPPLVTTPEPQISIDPAIVVLSVDPSTIVRDSLPGGLFGVNVEWIEHANGMADSGGKFHPRWANIATEAAVDHVRWPGGTFSDYYHWKDGIGTLASRPMVSHHTDTATEVDVVGTAGISQWAKSFGGKMLITVNAGTGTAAEAADWVTYCNAAIDSRRSADGLATPINVDDWEVGNELYLPHNPGTPAVAMSASQYADKFNQFATTMRAAVPSHLIRMIAIAEASSTWYPTNDPNWLNTLLAKAAPQIDLVAVHNAYHPVLYNNTEASRSTKDVYQALWAAPEAVAESLDALSSVLAASEKAQGLPDGKIGLAITEWGTLFGSDRRWVDQGKTLGSALYVARLFQVMAERDRVRMADAFKLTDSFTQGWVAFNGEPKPIWQVFSLMARQKGNAVVKSQLLGGGSYATARIGSVEARTTVSDVTSLATLSKDTKKLSISVINRSWDKAYSLSLALPPNWSTSIATSYSLSGSSVTNHNGNDVQSWISSQLYYDPPRDGPVSVATTTLGTNRVLIIPNHAVVLIELSQ